MASSGNFIVIFSVFVATVNSLEFVHQPGKYEILILLPISDEWDCSGFHLSALLAKDQALKTLRSVNEEVFGSQVLGAKIYGTCGSYKWFESRLAAIPTDDFIGFIGPVGTSKTYESIRYISASLPQMPLNAMQTSLDILNPRNQLDLKNRLKNRIMRVEPSDFDQSLAIVKVLEEFGWTYVNLLIQERGETDDTSNVLKKELHKRGFCIDTEYSITRSDDSRIVQQLASRTSGTRVNIVIARADRLERLLQTFDRVTGNAADRFVWITTNSPIGSVSGQTASASRLLSVVVPKLHDYEPEIVEKMKECQCSQGQNAEVWYRRYCQLHDNCANLEETGELLAVEPAVTAMVKATKLAVDKESCGNNCTSAQLRNSLLDSLKHVNFTLHGLRYDFHASSDTTLQTKINYLILESGEWRKVGDYELNKMELNSAVKAKFSGFSSVCSLPCSEGQTKSMSAGNPCCWICVNN